MATRKIPTSLDYAQVFLAKVPEDTLAEALNQAILSYDQGKCIPLLHLAQHIIDDLNNRRLCFVEMEEPKTERVYRGYKIDELDGEITPEQIGYLAGLSKKVNLDRYDLPPNISPKRNYKELTEGEAIIVIDTLKDMAEGI